MLLETLASAASIFPEALLCPSWLVTGARNQSLSHFPEWDLFGGLLRLSSQPLGPLHTAFSNGVLLGAGNQSFDGIQATCAMHTMSTTHHSYLPSREQHSSTALTPPTD